MSSPVLASFRPSPSAGWVWLLGLTAVIAASGVPLVLPGVVAAEERIVVWATLAIIVPLVGYLLLALVSLPTMRYDLTTDELVLSCGPLYRYRVPYAQITGVHRTTLTPTLWSSTRMPGLAIGGVPYAGVGIVKMCATRMSRDILVVAAGKRRYGLTPDDETGFMATLTSLVPHLESPASKDTFGGADVSWS
ncbi:MAG: PH domain-containing protein [Coriobacteriia bacterium]|nr:PH domain-containing protein [Coriobacteriia bacterium]